MTLDDFARVGKAALDSIETLLSAWFPNGVREGAEFCVGSRDGESGQSLRVRLTGTKAGLWSDFSSDGEAGGDLISLYGFIHSLSPGRACAALAGQLGIELSKSDWPRRPVQPQPKAAPGRALAEAGKGVEGASAALSPVRTPINPAPAQAGKGVEAQASKKAKTPWQPILPVPDAAGPYPRAHLMRGKPEASWEYRDIEGRLLGVIYRFVRSDGLGKEVLPCIYAKHPDTGVCDWRWMAFPEPRPLYLRGPHRPACPLVVVEGEKCVDAAHKMAGNEIEFVSWPGGGKAVGKADWSAIRDRDVILWPDADGKVYKEKHERAGQAAVTAPRGAVQTSAQVAGAVATPMAAASPAPVVMPKAMPVATALPTPLVLPAPQVVSTPAVAPTPMPKLVMPAPVAVPSARAQAATPVSVSVDAPVPKLTVPAPVVVPLPRAKAATTVSVAVDAPVPKLTIPAPVVVPSPRAQAATPVSVAVDAPVPKLVMPAPVAAPSPRAQAAAPVSVAVDAPVPKLTVPAPVVMPSPHPRAAMPVSVAMDAPVPQLTVPAPVVVPSPRAQAATPVSVAVDAPVPKLTVLAPVVVPSPHPRAAMPVSVAVDAPVPKLTVPAPVVVPSPHPRAATPVSVAVDAPVPKLVMPAPVAAPSPRVQAATPVSVAVDAPVPKLVRPAPVAAPSPRVQAATPVSVAVDAPVPKLVMPAPVAAPSPRAQAAMPVSVAVVAPVPKLVMPGPVAAPSPRPQAAMPVSVAVDAPVPKLVMPAPVAAPAPAPVSAAIQTPAPAVAPRMPLPAPVVHSSPQVHVSVPATPAQPISRAPLLAPAPIPAPPPRDRVLPSAAPAAVSVAVTSPPVTHRDKGRVSEPRGVRNNNPGNLREWGNRPREDGFAVFDTMEAGLTASVKNLLAQQRVHGLDTISGIISRWAPRKENNTGAYVADMVKKTGFGANDRLNLQDPQVVTPLITGIIKHEGNGSGVTDELISKVVAAQLGKASVAGSNTAGNVPAGGIVPPASPKGADRVEVALTLYGLPSGVSASAKARDGSTVPVRVAYTMPTGVTP